MSLEAMPELSVIIVNYNTRQLLRTCLAELTRRISALDASVVVVDNGSSDGSADMMRREFPDVRLITSEVNLGFARANNEAIEATNSRSLLLLNTDAFLGDGALEEMRRVMQSDEQIAVVGPRIQDGNGLLLASAHRFESVGKLAATALGIHKVIPRSFVSWAARFLGRTGELHRLNYEADVPVDVDWVSGACMLVSRSAIANVGLMDERYFMYMEDEDWCRRFRDASYRVVYAPSARVTHLVGRSSESSLRAAWAYRDSRLRYHRRYTPRLYRVCQLLSNLHAMRQWGPRAAAHLLVRRPRFGTGTPAPGEAEL